MLVTFVIKAQLVDTKIFQNDFNESERLTISHELNSFRFVVFYLLFFDEMRRGKLTISAEGLGRTMSTASALAYQDEGFSQADAISKTKEIQDITEQYLDAISKKQEKDIKEKGIFFFACTQFSNRVSPILNFSDETQRIRQFVAFDAAKQIYRIVERFFFAAYKKVQVVC